MKNIVFLGSKSIGLHCLKQLFEKSKSLNYNLIGILTNSRGTEILNFAKENGIRVIQDLDEYLRLEDRVDIAISVQYHLILKEKHIDKAKEITVNLHMAPLPEYRGCNQFSFAILDNKKEFGTTLHRLEAGIDSGDILFEKRFKIPENIWVNDLYERTFNASLKMFDEHLKDLVKGNYTLIPQEELVVKRGCAIHYRKEIEEIKKIDLDWSSQKINKHIRATYFPGFEPPYTIIDSKKIHFTKET